MTQASRLVARFGLSLLLAPQLARAELKEYAGRTGFPTVREGKEKVWMDRGIAVLELRDDELVVTQSIRMTYPGRNFTRRGGRIKVAVREDYFRSIDEGARHVRRAEARGFRRFGVTVDGRSVETAREPWALNDKSDTATRWRTWWISFRPGQTRQMRIVSVAPIGRQGNHGIVEFVSKDLGHWRDKPDLVEIRFEAPGRTETRVAGLEPRPNDQTRRGVRWVYRKASPNRDVFIMLPASYPLRERASL